MKKKSLALFLVLTVILSAFSGFCTAFASVTIPSDLPSGWVQVYADDFNGRISERFMPASSSADSGIIETGYSASNLFVANYSNYARVWDGYIGIFAGRLLTKKATITPTAAATDIPANNRIDFKMAQFYPGVSTSWDGMSTAYMRFAISANGRSYYEIGRSGSSTALSHYQLPVSEVDGSDIQTGVPSATLASGNGYAYREYFRVVKNDVTTYIKWGDSGIWDSLSGSTPTAAYNRRNNCVLSYDNPVRLNDGTDITTTGLTYTRTRDRWADVSVMTNGSTVSWSFSEYRSTGNVAWTGSYVDGTPLARDAAPFAFSATGHEAGIAIDDLAVYSTPLTDWQTWTADLSQDVAPVKTVTSINNDWRITSINSTYGEAYIENGWLVGSSMGGTMVEIVPKSFVAKNISANNTISFDFAQYSKQTGGDKWALYGTVAVRFAESGSSYYEIGKQGSSTSCTKYKLPNAGADGTPITVTVNGIVYDYAVDVTKDENGTKTTITPTADNCTFTDNSDVTYTAINNNYRFRGYFRKVVDGQTVYIEWENQTDGLYQKSLSTISPPDYTRCMQSLKSATLDRHGHISVTTTLDGVSWAFSPNDTNTYATWNGVYTDTAPLAQNGSGITIIKAGYEMGVGISNFQIRYDPNEVGTPPIFYDDFSLYNNDENTITDEYILASGSSVLATNPQCGWQWITSDVYTGSYGGVNNGKAYIDLSKEALRLKGYGANNIASVNLEAGEGKKFTDLNKVEFTMGLPARNAGVRMFVSGNEKYFVEFGFTGGETSRYYESTDAYDFIPMIRKSANPGSGDKSIWTTTEMNANDDVLIYSGDAFEVGSANGLSGWTKMDYSTNTTVPVTLASSAASTVTTETAWSNLNTAVTYTIEINDDGTIDWDVCGNRAGHSYGTIDDADVKTIMDADWVYPVAFASGGDSSTMLTEIAVYGATEDYDPTSRYDNTHAYTEAEFQDMYREADYGRDSQVHALMNLDLSNVTGDTATADVEVTKTLVYTQNALIGSHYGFGDDSYDKFYEDDGTLKPEYVSWARSQKPIPSVRFGGTSSSAVNFWATVNGQKSYYINHYNTVLNDTTVNETTGEQNNLAHDVMRMGLVETIKALQVNNSNMSFILCVSPFTTSKADVTNLVKFFIGTDQDSQVLRYNKFGSTNPINLYAIEIGNEVDGNKTDARKLWYLKAAKEIIEGVNAADPNGTVKIIACGPTAPWDSANGKWGNLQAAKDWVTALINGITYNNETVSGIANSIDSLSFHPYYYGHPPRTCLDYADIFRQQFEDAGKDIKITLTEHAVYWNAANSYYSSPKNSGLFAGLANSYFLLSAANRSFVDAAYSHDLIGTSPRYSRWQYATSDESFHANPLTTAYDVLSNAWGGDMYVTNVTNISDTTDAYRNTKTNESFTASTVKVSDDTINLIFVNNQGYTPVDANIDLAPEFEDYKLTKKVSYTAPNMFTFMFDAECENLATVDEIVYSEPEVFGDRHVTVPQKSLVVLTLSGSASTVLADDFNYADTEVINPLINEETGDCPEINIATNANGTAWKTSSANIGGDEYATTTGNAQIINSTLKVSNVSGAVYPMGVNWDISGYKEEPYSINKIEFTTTNDGIGGGVLLFVKQTSPQGYPVEESEFNFSNSLCGLNGTINWTITIDDGTLTWKAVDASKTAETGTMPITDADMTGYNFFAQVYVNGGLGSVTLDDLTVSYGAETPVVSEPTELLSYEKLRDTLSVTVAPKFTDRAFTVFVGYYSNDTLTKLSIIGSYAINDATDTVLAELPALGETAKIFVWEGFNKLTPLHNAIDIE